MFGFIQQSLHKIYTHCTSVLSGFFGYKTIDQQTLKELEKVLLSADTGVKTTRMIIEELSDAFNRGNLADGAALHDQLGGILENILNKIPQPSGQADVYVLVGINGSGKTTFAAKLAHILRAQNKKPLFAACDTFRAAAPEQLKKWADIVGIDVVVGNPEQDPAAVAFNGTQEFLKGGYDTLIVDTAGRLQTKTNLMNELAKIKRVIQKALPDKKIVTLLTIDAMLGQNSLEQARIFKECTDISGIVLTKMDGTGKGGIIFSIVQELHIPIMYLSYGESIAQCKRFDANEYVQDLLVIHES